MQATLGHRSQKPWVRGDRRARDRRWVLGAAVLVGLLAASCKDATQARLLVRTNVEYRPAANIAVWAGTRTDATGSPLAVSAEPWLADGSLGDLVITPRDRKDEVLAVRVTMGIGRDATTCSDADAKGCIVAKRKLRFVPSAGLRVPVVLHLACESVVCSEDTTCNYLGKCVSAQVDATACAGPEGCVLPGDETVTGTRSADAGLDRASTDAPTDAPISDGPLVDGSPADAQTFDVTPFDADAGMPASRTLAGGDSFTCARLPSGAVKCWGINNFGQLGLGALNNRGGVPGEMGAALPAVDFGPGRTAIELAAGDGHACARLDNGDVKCWGANNNGQLGLGDVQPRGRFANEMGANLPPIDLGPGRTAVELAAGNAHTCARLDNGQVKCWGQNADGQLGLGDIVQRGDQPGEMGANLPPVNLGNEGAVELSTGARHTCARLTSGNIKCWGLNLDGQLGLGDINARGDEPGEMAALPIVDLGGIAVEVSGGFHHTCARLASGATKCWGKNDVGQLGLGDLLPRGGAPATMGVNLPAVDLGGQASLGLSTALDFTCSVLSKGNVACWGSNNNGQLGLGDTALRGSQPGHMGAALASVNLGAGRVVTQLSSGYYRACARFLDESIKCWGFNGSGELGIGDTQHRGVLPGQMGAALPFVTLE